MDLTRKQFLKNALLGTGGLALWSSGCSDGFLSRKPTDQITNASFWNTASDLKVYNNSIYNLAKVDHDVPIMMGHDNSAYDSRHWGVWYLDEMSDIMAPVHPRQTFYNLIKSGKAPVPATPSDQWYGYKGWEFLRAVNYGLAHYDLAPVSQEVRDKYAAEARLFRGWFYGEKVQKFGNVAWVDKPLNIKSEELTAPRTPRDEVMANVLKDLNFACENLPDDWGLGGGPGRLNRWCALAVKSRICLFEGTWKKYHNGSGGTMWLEEAAKAAEDIINNGPYELYNTGHPQTDYNSWQRKLDLAGNPEIIYWRKSIPSINGNWVMSYFTDYSGGVTKKLVESYLCTDGKPISTSNLYRGDEVIEDVFKNRDPRLRQTVLHPADDIDKYNYNADDRQYPRVKGMTGRWSTTGYHIIKYYNYKDYVGKSYGTGQHPGVTIRLAEVLLNYAEAKAELGTITQNDLNISINRLRDRVAMPHLHLANVPVDPRHANEEISPLIVEIRRERMVELAVEGFRYKDLMRWRQGKELTEQAMGMRWNAKAKARYEGAHPATVEEPGTGKMYINPFAGLDWDNPVFNPDKHYLWPIPKSVLSKNPNITQNPGW